MSYRIFTDATADLTGELLAGLPEVEVIPMEITLGDRGYTHGPGGDLTVEGFYAAQRAGLFASTSQINPAVYFRHFEPCLAAGEDVLYLCFSSGLSGTFQTACLCAEELREQYPARKLVCLDTLCASVGEGFLFREAARKQAEGLSLEELAAWVEERRLQVCHLSQCFAVPPANTAIVPNRMGRHCGMELSTAWCSRGCAWQSPGWKTTPDGFQIYDCDHGDKTAFCAKVPGSVSLAEPGVFVQYQDVGRQTERGYRTPFGKWSMDCRKVFSFWRPVSERIFMRRRAPG